MRAIGMEFPLVWLRSFLRLLFILVVLATRDAVGAGALISDDAYFSTAERRKNFGASPVLLVSENDTAFLRFDLSALPDNLLPEQIAKATLQLWVNKVTRPGAVNVVSVSGEWSEATLSFSNAPVFEAENSITLTIPTGKTRFYASVDLTSVVRQWVTRARANQGIALLSKTGGASLRIDSKENTATSHEPHLEIALAGPAGPPGMEGLKGEKGDKGEKGEPGSPAVIPAGTVTAFPLDEPSEGYEPTGEIIASSSILSGGVAGAPSVSNSQIAESDGQFFAFSRPTKGIRVITDGTTTQPTPPVVYRFDRSSALWTEEPNPLAFSYNASAARLDNGSILVFGGVRAPGVVNVSPDTFEFTPATSSWRTRAPLNIARQGGVGAFTNGRLFVFGGIASDSSIAPVEEFDPNTNRWTQLGSLPAGFQVTSTAVVGNIIYVYGTGIPQPVMRRFDAQQRVWLEPASEIPVGAWLTPLEDGTGSILLFGGAGQPIFQYSVASGDWSFRAPNPSSYPNAPFAAFRLGNTAYLISNGLSVLTLQLDSFRELRIKR